MTSIENSARECGAPGKKWILPAFMVFMAMCWLAPIAIDAAETSQTSPDVMKQVLDRLEKAEAEINKANAEIKDLKAELASRPPAASQSTNAAATVPDSQLQQRVERDEAKINDLQSQFNGNEAAAQKPKYPNIQFHGFGDFDYAADNRRSGPIPTPTGVTALGGKNTFIEGELDLFTTSQLAENISFTLEPVLSAGLNNFMGLDLERTYLEYRPEDYLNVDVGRIHTALGYYSTTYHHGTWLQTAIGRPTIVQFEDAGGILPIHMTGVSLFGAIPSGPWNLNYVFEVGNGMDFSSNPNVNPVQQVTSFSDSKAVNVAMTCRPDGVPGLQFGGGLYFDSITPDLSTMPIPGQPHSLPSDNQYIPNAHIVYHNSLWEIINEFYLIRDDPIGARAHNNPAFFTQISRKFGLFTPYARFTYYDISHSDLLYALAWAGGVNAGVHYGPSVGLRYDFADYAAIKAQYDYLIDSGANDASRITLQLCFTF